MHGHKVRCLIWRNCRRSVSRPEDTHSSSHLGRLICTYFSKLRDDREVSLCAKVLSSFPSLGGCASPPNAAVSSNVHLKRLPGIECIDPNRQYCNLAVRETYGALHPS